MSRETMPKRMTRNLVLRKPLQPDVLSTSQRKRWQQEPSRCQSSSSKDQVKKIVVTPRYLKAFGGVFTWLVIFAVSVCWLGLNITATTWLSMWVTDSLDRSSLYYGNIYTIIIGVTCVVVFLRSIVIANGAVRAATYLHSKMLAAILGARVVFFDTELTVYRNTEYSHFCRAALQTAS